MIVRMLNGPRPLPSSASDERTDKLNYIHCHAILSRRAFVQVCKIRLTPTDERAKH